MGPVMIRRVKMDDSENRADIVWVLFRQGEIRNPLAVLDDYEVKQLAASIDLQSEGR